MRRETHAHERQRQTLFELLEARGLGARRELVAKLIRPGIGLRTRAATDADRAVGASRVGGEPDLPPSLAWPAGAEGPLLFVMQVDLAQVAPFDLEARLPSEGLLSVFADPFAQEVRVFHFEPHGMGGPGDVNEALARRETPETSPHPPFRACGIDVLAELHLPPPASCFMDTADGHPLLDADEHDVYWDDVWLTCVSSFVQARRARVASTSSSAMPWPSASRRRNATRRCSSASTATIAPRCSGATCTASGSSCHGRR